MSLSSQDFKSCVSADSTIPANDLTAEPPWVNAKTCKRRRIVNKLRYQIMQEIWKDCMRAIFILINYLVGK